MIVLRLLQLYSVKSQGNAAIVVQIYWTHVRPPVGNPAKIAHMNLMGKHRFYCT